MSSSNAGLQVDDLDAGGPSERCTKHCRGVEPRVGVDPTTVGYKSNERASAGNCGGFRDPSSAFQSTV